VQVLDAGPRIALRDRQPAEVDVQGRAEPALSNGGWTGAGTRALRVVTSSDCAS
jgi:hypothetical protein